MKYRSAAAGLLAALTLAGTVIAEPRPAPGVSPSDSGMAEAARTGVQAEREESRNRASYRWQQDPEKVRRIQQALNDGGAKLAVDGRMGTETRNELRRFQEKSNLQVTGRIDEATMEKLGIR